jgi:hypothetical protein
MAPKTRDEQPPQTAIASRMAEHAAMLTSEVVVAFRHDAIGQIDFLSLHLSRAARALKVEDTRGARESIAKIDVGLQDLAREIDSLKVLSANPRRPAQALTYAWEHLVRALGANTRQAGVKLELRRNDHLDPFVPAPIVLALVTATAMGLKAAASTHRRHRLLLVEAERSAGDQVTLRVRFPSPVQRNDDTTLSMKLVTALLAGCNGRSSVSGSDQLVDMTMTFPFQEGPNR